MGELAPSPLRRCAPNRLAPCRSPLKSSLAKT
ncbi:hypothetical protein BPC006_I0376 [Burkholderia pseudomallei BPC006]|nr:hypothetical protein BPC006_I0376 [Burkholderia pseudomallei BPC006]